MTNVICNTSPFQYLHQIDQLHILPALAGKIIVPSAVVDEIAAGRVAGVDLPDLAQLDWVMVQSPAGQSALPLISDLGAGESEVLMLALETPGATVILDDMLARRVAESLNLHLTGTLGLLLDAKQAGLISQVRPLLDQLQTLRFRLSPVTYQAVLKLADEL
ncbi:MAG: DUF3368 domain-containing protein [Anaerolineales bacterium]|nr:DUF3368 domain-containing protein [Anaerolineales bacterium]